MEAPGRPGEEQQQHRLRHPPPGNQAAMDRHLRSQGLRRKRVAKDGSCLFRAVAEQVFHSQTQHIAIRKACINYLRKNREKFEEFIEGSFEDYLKSLENPQEWVGQVEISALSLMYKKDFIIYQELNSAPSHVTENGFHDKVRIRLLQPDWLRQITEAFADVAQDVLPSQELVLPSVIATIQGPTQRCRGCWVQLLDAVHLERSFQYGMLQEILECAVRKSWWSYLEACGKKVQSFRTVNLNFTTIFQ